MTLFFGIRIYHKHNLLKDKNMLISFTNTLNLFSKVKINYYNFLLSDTAKSTRLQKWNMQKFLKELNPIYSHVGFYDRKINHYLFLNQPYSLNISLFLEKNLSNCYVFRLETTNIDLIKNFDKIVEKSFLKDFIYGYITVGKEWKKVSMETSLIPISQWEPNVKTKENNIEQKLHLYQQNEEKISSKVFKAYLGNFLNKKHILKLNLDNLEKELPTIIIRQLNNGFLLLLEIPDAKLSEKFYKNIKILDKLFLPIKIR